MIHAILIALGLSAAPYIGDCNSFQGTIDCFYENSFYDASALSALGRAWMLGPWADLTIDLVHPALRSIAGDRPVILNAKLGGSAMVTLDGREGLIANVNIQPYTCEYGVLVKDDKP